MAKRRSVAIVGAGIGEKHMKGYQAVAERFCVRTVCDLDEARGQALAATNPETGFTTSLEDVLTDSQIEIVDICLPPHLHFSAGARALEARKHVICEKPLATSLRDADQLIEIAKASGRQLFPVFQYRYGKAMAALQALIDAGLAGVPYVATLETHWNRPVAYYDIGWRGTWAGEQGGAVLSHAIHVHDLVCRVLGPIASVHAELGIRVNAIEVDDCAALAIRMENGALVTSSITLGASNDSTRLRFCFAGLTAESDRNAYSPATEEWTFEARAPVSQADIDAVLAAVPEFKPGFAGFFDAIADALDDRGGNEVTLLDGRRSLEFVTAIYASARGRGPVELPLGADHSLYDGWTP